MDTPKMTFCGVCNKEVIKATGKDREGNDLCGKCYEAYRNLIVRGCKHEVMAEDGITCTDCGAKPRIMRRVAKASWGFTKAFGKMIVQTFMMYTIPSIISTGVVAGLAYFIGKKLGLF